MRSSVGNPAGPVARAYARLSAAVGYEFRTPDVTSRNDDDGDNRREGCEMHVTSPLSTTGASEGRDGHA